MGLIRLFLACVVAGDHFREFVLKSRDLTFSDRLFFGMDAAHAVLCFYTISGFLISYALTHKYHSKGVLPFYKSRFLRIYPLYWSLVIFVLAINLMGARNEFLQHLGERKFIDIIWGIALIGVDWRFAFATYPTLYTAPFFISLSVVWTLGAELMFYLLAPFILRSNKIALTLLLLSALTRALLVHHYGGFETTWTYVFLPSTFMFFMLGHFAHVLYTKYFYSFKNLLFIFGPLAVLCMLRSVGHSFDGFWVYAFFFSFLLFLPHLFEKTKNLRWSNFFGNLSYPLYLVHSPIFFMVYLGLPLGGQINGFLESFLPHKIWPFAETACFLLLCMGASTVLHYCIEWPIHNFRTIQAFFTRRPSPAIEVN